MILCVSMLVQSSNLKIFIVYIKFILWGLFPTSRPLNLGATRTVRSLLFKVIPEFNSLSRRALTMALFYDTFLSPRKQDPVENFLSSPLALVFYFARQSSLKYQIYLNVFLKPSINVKKPWLQKNGQRA